MSRGALLFGCAGVLFASWSWFQAGVTQCRRGDVHTISTPALSLQNGVWVAERRVVDDGGRP